MAIVEDEVRNESEEENEIEVVVEEDDGDQDSDDSDDDEDEEVLERKVAELERRIAEDPYHYDDHIDLIQALWGLTELDRWRAAFERLQALSSLRAEHWLLRLRTEVTLAHSAQEQDHIEHLFQQAALDCYSIPILSEWCSWALTGGAAAARERLDDVLRRAGPDPLNGKLFWDAKLELEKSQLETLSADSPDYSAQQERVLWCLEEAASRPLLRAGAAWPPLRDLATALRDQAYLDKIQKQHEAAMEYLQEITQFEDKLLTLENPEEKCTTYQEYIEKVKQLSQEEKYAECDSNGILKVLYDRATTECLSCAAAYPLLVEWARHSAACSSRGTQARVLQAGTRRCPRRHAFWALRMQRAEKDGERDEVKSIFETALSKGMETYKEAESLWMSYLEFTRRSTAFDNEADVDKLRATFRLAWDSLAEAWGEEANDCEVPLYWARLEYRRVKDHKHGKEIFEEIFNYGENKTMSKYWEALISLEWTRSPPPSENKLRELFRRALRFVADYPPSVVRLWTDYERDYGQLATMRECTELCEAKLKEWKDNYQKMKDKMTGDKQKGKQQNKGHSKKTKIDNKKKKKEEEPPKKGKRKSDQKDEGSEVKRKKEGDMEVDEKGTSSSGVKRSHDNEDNDDSQERMTSSAVSAPPAPHSPHASNAPKTSTARTCGISMPTGFYGNADRSAQIGTETKRPRKDSGSSERSAARDACTLFVSNLEFKIDEQKVRDELSKYGDIVSLRVRSGVKAFGGSICYCQYKTPESVDEALKHDRSPLEGRPMFFSRYSAKKTKQNFKYATTTEKNKLFVKNLPYSHCTREALTEIFNKNGKLKDVRVVTFKDGKPKGLAYIEYEDEESAAQALQATNGTMVEGRALDVAVSAPPPRKDPDTAPSLGQSKREATGGMRRTQLSSFIPSVLQKASTSAAANGSHSNGDDKRPLSNADFRSMLLK